MLKKALNKNIICYYSSSFLKSISLGVFILLFNIFITERIDSPTFLGTYLLFGNIAMALGGVLLGRKLDNVSRKKLLIISTLFASVFMITSFILVNVFLLLLISFAYGLSYSIIMCMRGPVLMSYGKEEYRAFLFSTASSVGLAGLSVGVFLGGVLGPLNFIGTLYQIPLIISGLIFVASVVPLLFMNPSVVSGGSEHSLVKTEELPVSTHNFKVRPILMFAFFIIGLAILFSPYVNIYFHMRFNVNIVHLSLFMFVIQVAPIVVNFTLSRNVKKSNIKKYILCSLAVGGVSYVLLAITYSLWIHMFLVLIASCSISFALPLISNFIYESIPKENYGKAAGIFNFFYNFGDAAGTYVEGALIGFSLFAVSFGIAGATLFVLFLVFFLLSRNPSADSA